MNHMIKKILIALIVVAGLSACGNRSASLSVPETAKAGELVDLEECTYKLNKTKYQAECGNLVVSENRSNPGSRLITLPVIRVLALNENPADPIFWLAGGPGGTNLKFPKLDELIEDHDIVLVGYRGVDGTSRLDCREITQALKGTGDNLLNEVSLAAFGESTIQCAERLRSEGNDLDGYSIPEVVEDLEDARIVLGYKEINLLSGSYGTRVAMIYSWMYPENINRSAMIAVNPPGHFVWEPSEIDALIAYDAALCAKDPYCSTRTDNLELSIRNALRDLPKSWMLIPIDPGKVNFITQFMLFHRGTAALVFDTFLAAENGDPSGLALMSLVYDLMIPTTMTWGDWMAKGSIDYDPERDWIRDMNQADSVMGSPVSILVGGAAQLRGGWPVAPMSEAFHSVQSSEVETLLVSGSIDYSTPAQFAEEELLPALSKGQQVILAEYGHVDDIENLQPKAINHLLKAFFDNGQVDDSLFSYQPMDFKVGLGFPELAKISLVVLFLLFAGLIALVRYIIRRIRHKKGIRQGL
jgi:pimeloyl-ACP methyl ester carboxylesterase